MSSAARDIDAALIERLNQLQIREASEALRATNPETGEPSPRSPRVSVLECVVPDPEAPKKTRAKGKKHAGKKRVSGYQHFVSKEFPRAKKDLATGMSFPGRMIPAPRVFCELGRRWRSFSQLEREAWVAAAANNGPTPPSWREVINARPLEYFRVVDPQEPASDVPCESVSGLRLLTAKRGVADGAPGWNLSSYHDGDTDDGDTDDGDTDEGCNGDCYYRKCVDDKIKPHGWWRERKMTTEEADDLVCSMDGLGNAW